jgi:hypothetical protein
MGAKRQIAPDGIAPLVANTREAMARASASRPNMVRRRSGAPWAGAANE